MVEFELSEASLQSKWVETMSNQESDLAMLTVDLLSAFVAHNNVRAEDLSGLIKSVHDALAALGAPGNVHHDVQDAPAIKHVAATSVRKSLASPDHIISMIDGKHYRSLKRHLSANGLSFAEYKARYNLPDDYPSVAPGYSEARRAVAMRLGLGRSPAAKHAAKTSETPKKRGRPRKSAVA